MEGRFALAFEQRFSTSAKPAPARLALPPAPVFLALKAAEEPELPKFEPLSLVQALNLIGIENVGAETLPTFAALESELLHHSAPELQEGLTREFQKIREALNQLRLEFLANFEDRNLDAPAILHDPATLRERVLGHVLRLEPTFDFHQLELALNREKYDFATYEHHYGTFREELGRIDAWMTLGREQKIEMFQDILLEAKVQSWSEGGVDFSQSVRNWISGHRDGIEARIRERFPEGDAALRNSLHALMGQDLQNPEVREALRTLTAEALGWDWARLRKKIEWVNRDLSTRYRYDQARLYSLAETRLDAILDRELERRDPESFAERLHELDSALDSVWALHQGMQRKSEFLPSNSYIDRDHFVAMLFARDRFKDLDWRGMAEHAFEEGEKFLAAVAGVDLAQPSSEISQVVQMLEADDQMNLDYRMKYLSWYFLTSADRQQLVQAIFANAWNHTLHLSGMDWERRLHYMTQIYFEQHHPRGGQEYHVRLLGHFSQYYHRQHPDIALGQTIFSLFAQREWNTPELTDTDGNSNGGAHQIDRILDAALEELDQHRGRVQAQEYRKIFDQNSGTLRREVYVIHPRLEAYGRAMAELFPFRGEDGEIAPHRLLRLNQVYRDRREVGDAFVQFYEAVERIPDAGALLIQDVERVFNPETAASALAFKNGFKGLAYLGLQDQIRLALHPDRHRGSPHYGEAFRKFAELLKAIKVHKGPSYGTLRS